MILTYKIIDRVFKCMHNNKLLVYILGILSLLVSCKSDIEKRDQAIIATINQDKYHHYRGNPIEQIITVYQADSLDYWPSTILEMPLYEYADVKHSHQIYKGYNEQLSKDYHDSMIYIDKKIQKLFKSLPRSPRDGVWVVEEYRYYDGRHNSQVHPRVDYYIYKFSDQGNLVSEPEWTCMGNPFELINELSPQQIYSSSQISYKTGEEYADL